MKLALEKIKIAIKQGFIFSLFILAFSASVIAIIYDEKQNKAQNLNANNQYASQFNVANNYNLRSLSGIPDYEVDREANLAPNSIYMLDTFEEFLTKDDPTSSRDSLSDDQLDILKNYKNAFSEFGIPNADFDSAYYDLINWLSTYLGNTDVSEKLKEEWDGKAKDAFDLFTVVNNVQNQFNDINNLGVLKDSEQELQIYRPTKIFNVKNATSGTNYDVTATYLTDLEYKVAQIPVDALKGQTSAALVFDITNKATPGFTNTNYQIIIDNKDDELYTIAQNPDNQNNNNVIEKLVANSNIIVRETEQLYDPEQAKTSLDDLFTIEFDGVNINIFIKPQSDSTTPITFKATNSNAQKFAKVGFLDSTVSPIHQEENYKDAGDVKPFKSDDFLSKFDTHKMKAANPDGTSATFWMKLGEEITFDLFLNQNGDIFVGDNKFTLTFKDQDAGVTSSIYKKEISQGSGDIAGASLTWTYDIYQFNNNGENFLYAKVDLTADGSKISFNYDKQANRYSDLVVQKLEDKIFWEVPANFALGDGASLKKGEDLIVFNITSDTSNIAESYLDYTYANMAGKIKSDDESRGKWYLDDAFLGDQRIYDFNYSFYYANNEGGINEQINKNVFLTSSTVGMNPNDIKNKIISHDLTTGNYSLDKDGNVVLLDANGKNLALLLNETYNRYEKWLREKFEQTTDLKGQNYYWPSLSSINSWVDVRILDHAGSQIEKEIRKKVDTLVKLAFNRWEDLSSDEQTFINGLSDPSNPYYIDLSSLSANSINEGLNLTVKDLLKGKITLDEYGNINWTDLALQANQLIMVFTEHFLVEAIEQILVNENDTFKNIYASLLSDAMQKYLESSDNFTGISNNALKKLSPDQLSNNFKDKSILTISGDPKITVTSGANQLQSLLDFIIDFSLETYYLGDEKGQEFKTFSENGLLTNPSSYDNIGPDSDMDKMITMFDKIIDSILGEDNQFSFKELITKLETGQMVNAQAITYIGNTVGNMIDKIVSGKEDAFIYEALNTYATSSYLENIVIGNNLSVLYQKWIELHPELDDQTKLQLTNLGFYDPDTIVKISIALAYYNVAYFLDALVDENKVVNTLDELLKADLASSVTFEIPETNWFIDATTDTGTVAQYSLIGLGVLMSALGSMVVFMAFKKGLVLYLSNKAIMSARVASVVVIVLGITLLIIGAIIGPL